MEHTSWLLYAKGGAGGGPRDGLGAHRRTDKVRELIEERVAELLFVASYSPDHRTP